MPTPTDQQQVKPSLASHSNYYYFHCFVKCLIQFCSNEPLPFLQFGIAGIDPAVMLWQHKENVFGRNQCFPHRRDHQSIRSQYSACGCVLLETDFIRKRIFSNSNLKLPTTFYCLVLIQVRYFSNSVDSDDSGYINKHVIAIFKPPSSEELSFPTLKSWQEKGQNYLFRGLFAAYCVYFYTFFPKLNSHLENFIIFKGLQNKLFQFLMPQQDTDVLWFSACLTPTRPSSLQLYFVYIELCS